MNEKANIFVTDRTMYVLNMAILLFYLILQKEIKELKIASFILFGGIASFISVFLF